MAVGEPFPSELTDLVSCCDRHLAGLPQPEAILVSNVGGACAGEAVLDWFSRHWPAPVRFVQSEASTFGVANAYPNPRQLGVDRWLGLIGARQIFREAVCVVSAGTAITIDLLDGNGRHRGGLIAPGLAMMRSALGALDALGAPAETFDGFFCRSTGAAVSSGIVHSAAALIESSLAHANSLLDGGPPGFLLTGGDAETLRAHINAPCSLVPHLVLQGLHAIAEQSP